MAAPASIYRRFIASRRAVAAIEFAMIMPILLLLFLGSYDAGNGISAYIKVRSATYTLAAIANQYSTGNSAISTTDMAAITGATSTILWPFTSPSPVVVISQIRAASASQATVSWSYSVNGTALTQGAPFNSLPTNFASNTCGGNYPCYVVLSSVSYTFSPTFGAFLTGPITLSDSLYATPRSSICVQYNGVPASC
jgi:Flp pilus assembly protein TadG